DPQCRIPCRQSAPRQGLGRGCEMISELKQLSLLSRQPEPGWARKLLLKLPDTIHACATEDRLKPVRRNRVSSAAPFARGNPCSQLQRGFGACARLCGVRRRRGPSDERRRSSELSRSSPL